MSLQKNVFHSLTPLKKSSSKIKLNILWKQFMSSFGYQKFYNNISKEINNSSPSYDIINNDSTDNSIKLFLEFLQENSISLINDNDNTYNLISSDKKSNEILSEAKIWIMFVIYVSQCTFKDKNYLNAMNIFKEAIKNECDIISLFEFFLIYISQIKEKDFCINFNMDKISELIPKEFIILYEQKKDNLKNIFKSDIFNNDNFKMRNSLKKFLSNDIMTNSHSTLFSSNKKENEKFNKINLDFDNIIIISKDYLNKGYFFIFQNKKEIKGNEILNSFMNLEFEEDDNDDYCLMPLLDKYKNYEQKMDANKILILINKSIYKNYTYFPHDKNIINRL